MIAITMITDNAILTTDVSLIGSYTPTKMSPAKIMKDNAIDPSIPDANGPAFLSGRLDMVSITKIIPVYANIAV